MTYADHIADQQAYYALCDEARKLGIPTSLDDPHSPKTIAGLRGAIDRERLTRKHGAPHSPHHIASHPA